MLVEFGHFALILALGMALLQSSVPVAGVWRSQPAWMDLARSMAVGQFCCIAIAFACLASAFLHDDFSVRLVAAHSNSALPPWFKFSAVWGNHEGSMLLWALLLSAWTAAVALASGNLTRDMRARALAVLGMVAVGFHLFILLTSNPFERSFPNVPLEGGDLNPLLQDIGLVLHPPILYAGYVGFSVAFAFALAALSGGRLDAAWARWSRPWTTAAWLFLSLGITLGSWWAYYELGWGGWWFWDPVENASFMPWLAGTALMHSLAVTEKRGLFRSWTVLLAIMAFSLSLLGTFLVRSGVLTSVHAFATDPERGLFVLVLLGIVVGGSLTLYALRAPAAVHAEPLAASGRETALLGNNILLVVALATVLIGTLLPLLVQVLGLGRISVGPPYFNMMFVPLMSLLALLLGVGPLLRWRATTAASLRAAIIAPLVVAVLAALLLPFALGGAWHAGVALAGGLAAWIVAATGVAVRQRLRTGNALAPAFLAMCVAHTGMAFSIAGVGFTTVYSSERDVRMAPGESAAIDGYSFLFEGTRHLDGPNFDAERGTFRVTRDGGGSVVLHPEKRNYHSQMGNVMTEAGIDAGFTRDLYVALGEPLENGAWAVRVHVKPFVRWIWLGGLLMTLGGVLALADRRYRRVAAAAPAGVAAARA